jgi:DNA-binding CsgD family transcriptional regulator
LGGDDGLFEARATLARFAITLGDAPRAHRELLLAEPLLPRTGCAAAAGFFEVRAEANAANGRTAAALDDCSTASRLARESRDSEAIVQIENNCALVAAELGDIAQAIQRHESALAEARRTSMQWRIAYSALNYAQTLTVAGELRRARELAWEAVESGVTTATFRTKAAAVGIPLALALNDRRLLEACARDESLEIARRSGEPQRIAAVSAAFAGLRSAQGAAEEARGIVCDAIGAIATPHRCTSLILHIIAAGEQPERAWAAAALQQNWTRPAILRACRLLLTAAGDAGSERSKRCASLAAAHFERFGWKLARARSLEFAGDVRAAHAAYVSMGNVRDAERLQSLLPTDGNAAGEGLSPRQGQIAQLVAEGATNRTIATALHISEHTVEHHLSNIFTRLGLRSRAALAARVGTIPQR